VFVSTHLISEFEGLIDRFTVLDQGKAVLTTDADEARSKFRRFRAEFAGEAPPESEFPSAKSVRCQGRTLELIVNGDGDAILAGLRNRQPVQLVSESLTLEEIFLHSVH